MKKNLSLLLCSLLITLGATVIFQTQTSARDLDNEQVTPLVYTVPSTETESSPPLHPTDTYTVTQQAKLLPSDSVAPYRFGTSVAIDGDTVVVGAPDDSDDGVSLPSGAAYVFTRSGSVWNLQAKLTPNEDAHGYEFGNAVAIDGDTIVVGAPYDYNPESGIQAGSIYIFTREGTTWSEQAKLIPESGRWTHFGYTVAVDGDTVVAGTYNPIGNNSAYIFTYNGTAWHQQTELYSFGDLGNTVAVDGDTIIIGAPIIPDRISDEPNCFCTSVFTRDGTTWDLQAELYNHIAPITGFSVAIDGDTVVSTEFETAVDVFTRSGTTWEVQATLTPDERGRFSSTSTKVAIEGDAIVIGSPSEYEDGTIFGSAYLFTRDDGTGWSQQNKFIGNDTSPRDWFGSDVAVDNNTIVVGAPGADYDSGSAYIFTFDPDSELVPTAITMTSSPASDSGYTILIIITMIVIGLVLTVVTLPRMR